MKKTAVDVLIYSDDIDTRKAVIEGVGRKAEKDLPEINWFEKATAGAAIDFFAEKNPDVLVLDGESTKIGGMAVARQIQNQFDSIPPIVLLTARPQDQWLATWAGADVIVSAPWNPLELQRALSRAIRLAS